MIRSRTCGVQRPGQPGQRRLQQLPRIVLGQALHDELGQPGHVLARDPRCEYQAYRVGRQPTGREPQRLRRGVVQPLLVIHHADQRAFPRRLRQQAQHGQAHQEQVRDWAGAEAERGPQRLHAAAPEETRHDPASARTADAVPRRPAPFPTARPLPALPGTPRPAWPGSPAARSCPPQAHRAPPGPGPHRPARRPRTGQVRHVPWAGPSAPLQTP